MRKRLSDEFRALRGANVTAVLTAVVPVTRGWSLYYRFVVSKEVFTAMDNEVRLRRGLLPQPGGRLRRT